MKDDDDEEEQSVGGGKYPCVPSLVALQQMRNRLHLARLGKKLMKWTAIATRKELRRIAAEMLIACKDYENEIRNAYLLLARCRYYYPNLNAMVVEGLPAHPKEAQTKVYSTFKSITGSRIVKFEISNNDKEPYVFLAIERGGETVAEAKKAWYILLRVMTRILQLKLSFVTAEMSHSGAKKKSNVLGKIVIPRINSTIKYILSELEEKDREEFYRIKKIMKVKEKQIRKKMELAGTLSTPKQVEEEEEEKQVEELPEIPLPPSPPKARVSVQLPSPPPESLPPTPLFKSEESLSSPKAPPIEPEPTPSPKPVPTPPPKPVPAAKPIPLPPAPLPLPSKVCKICKLSMQSPSDPNFVLPNACRVPLSISTDDLGENTCAICKRPLLKLPMLEQKISEIKPRLVPLQVETKEITKILRILKDGGIVFEEVKEIKIRTEHQLPQNVSDRICRLKSSACKMIQPFSGANSIRAAYCHQNAFIRTCTPSPYNNSILNGSLNYQQIASLTSLLKQYLGSTSEAWKSIEETSGIFCDVNITRSCSTVGPRPISDMAVAENDLFKEGEGEDIHKNTDDIFRNAHRAIITEIEDEFTSPDSNELSLVNDMENKIEPCTNNDICVKDTTILKTVTSEAKVNIIENEIKQLSLSNTEDCNNNEQ
ncbi:uncharacterized protein LOC105393867 isoform X1 [Plutella xylostella]|uniref:uncharacterized protein LOC105393867 isoform X1 n=1 Tax=Plutella xylostella TaxID=51655 RepID=UPI0020328D43|nr:uncharacterized protein LOC105393867 isoform X1 [Plutella xylostella]